jgi:hypothetical protein
VSSAVVLCGTRREFTMLGCAFFLFNSTPPGTATTMPPIHVSSSIAEVDHKDPRKVLAMG